VRAHRRTHTHTAVTSVRDDGPGGTVAVAAATLADVDVGRRRDQTRGGGGGSLLYVCLCARNRLVAKTRNYSPRHIIIIIIIL